MSDNILIHFPYMHKEFVSEILQNKALFLNPGLELTDEDNYFLPSSLVLTPREAKAYINECLKFGEQFKKPSDMAYFGLKGIDDFYTDTTLAIKSELIGAGDKKKDERLFEAKKAQMLLLLGYALEERIIELLQIDDKLKNSWQKFEQLLGVEKDDDIWAKTTFSTPIASQVNLGWEKLLYPFALFLPENGKLMVVDRQVQEALAEMGVNWEKKDLDIEGSPLKVSGLNVFEGVLKKEKLDQKGKFLYNDLKLLALV
ncbi:hypothetical protein KFV02_03585 [Desulfohalobiaceae bacterium Ax17]|uniref:hypothetical protein n=1 Tax=Desulfovulcanus ferrireducens TaxID=2831190 RepID=UPI00207BCA3B|nr:hypothetical protein [Desulfovulcanus ferrireducens]MBT8763008.1 hypothetical protein [Desulfovulcanus ferrireducens]